MSSDAFSLQYSRLNTAQKSAVDTIEGPVMVIAGPGTGKTTILTLRIANILKQTDTPAHGILAITYTDAGVKAMRHKLQSVIGNRAHDVAIHTFHSFASAVISEYPDHFVHLQGMRRMTEIEQESLINTILKEPQYTDLRPAGKPDAYTLSILKTIEESKREALTPEMVADFARQEIERIKNDPESISSRGATKGQLKADAKECIAKCERTILCADVYKEYETRKRESKRMDFSDLIIELLVALRQDELLLRLIQERFLYLHVDEHQDTNDSQNFIIALIAEFFETPNIFIVGDEKQAIYRFQGASVENFLLLQKRWPSMKVISLDTNYRSHQGILDASFGMIENNYDGDEHTELRVKLKSGISGDSLSKNKTATSQVLTVVTGENITATELYLVKELKAIAEREPEATVAIITRRNRDLDRVIRLLELHGVPVASERSVDIFNHPIGSLFFDFIEYLADPARLDRLAKTVVAGMWGISFDRAAELIMLLRGGMAGKGGALTEADLSKRLQNLPAIRARLLSDGPLGCLIHAAELSGYSELVASDPSYIHVWRGIVALAESLQRDGGTEEPSKLIADMLAYRASAESRPVKVTVGASDVPFQALTAHGSKGLEFDYVFLPYVTEESWVGRAHGSSFVLPRRRAADTDLRDVRRLFYVAITRARKQVNILIPQEESDGRVLSPLRFIEELQSPAVGHVSLPRADMETQTGQEKEAGSKEKGENAEHVTSELLSHDNVISQKFVDVAKRVLETSGLSVTALNHFLTCPNAFLYQSILKMPQAPSVPAEKGNAMHLALSKVWQLPPESRRDGAIETTIVEGITEYLNQSLLPVFEKEAIKKELHTDAPLVTKALEPHFSSQHGSNGAVFTELWVKSVFNGSFEGKNISIPIHGKLDAILDTGKEVNVFDYKTRQALSANAIKGETKNSDGGYFRQLIYYRLLLGEDPRFRGRSVLPSLVFVSPDDKGRCPIVTLPITVEDVDRVKKEIQSVIDAVWSGVIATSRCADEKCEWCGLRGL